MELLLTVLIITLGIIGAILLLGLTILVHEFGHYLAARLCGMVVDVFSIGFGPALWQTRRHGITYKIAAIPFGGYVALPQMEPPSAERRKEDSEREARDGHAESLPAVPAWKRIIVSLAGATGNVLLAVVLAWLAWTFYGAPAAAADPSGEGVLIGLVEESSEAYDAGIREADRILKVNGERISSWTGFIQVAALSQTPVLTVRSGDDAPREVRLSTEKMDFDIQMIPGLYPGSPCMVRGVQPGSPAEAAGIQRNDRILALDGIPLGSPLHMITLINEREDREVVLTVRRKEKTLEMTVVPRMDPVLERPLIGIEFAEEGVPRPLTQLRNDAAPVFRLLGALFRKTERREATRGVGGPVTVLTMLWLQVSAGLMSALTFTRFLNINLAIINLLPIPILDGGHILFALFEVITRRRVHPRVLHTLLHVFAILLIGLMLLLTFRDVTQFIPRLWRSNQNSSLNETE